MVGEKILIVDDDPNIRMLLKDRLEANGYRILEAENGIRGLESVAKENPDLILLDLQMPEMDGMEMLSRLRQDFPELTVVILTAYGTIEWAVEAMKLGAYDFLPKPCKPDHVLVVVKKALEQKELREELSETHQRLKNTQLQLIQSEKMASLSMLVAGIAHEINTPLGAINSTTDTLVRSNKKLEEYLDKFLKDASPTYPSEIAKTLQFINTLSSVNKTACEKINAIVKNLRSFAQLGEEEFKEITIQEGVDSTLDLIRHLYEDRIEIIKEYNEVPFLYCQAAQINQVFMNLLLNACQSIEETGVIRIKTNFKDGRLYVQFSDTGVGIPPENLKKIYDPGFTTKGVGVGIGLGLSIVYKIVEDHGGCIKVESEAGKGTTFLLEFPCTQK